MRRVIGLLLALSGLFGAAAAQAEPYLAVREGAKCLACHVSPSGGGLRNAYGNVYGRTGLAARPFDTGDEEWLGQIGRHLRLGGNLRASARAEDLPGGGSRDLAFAVDEFRAYLDVAVLPERLSVYLDQRFAPGVSSNLEAHARLWLGQSQAAYVRAGRFYLPFGLRLEDDTTFVRQASGIGFDTPDNGVEFGYERGPWSAQFALGNGSGGGPETGSGKQWSLRGERVQAVWRLGASFNFNDGDGSERRMAALFAGLRTGPVAWLAEADLIEDRGAGTRRQWAGLLEANWTPRRGHNLKGTVEFLDPDDDVDEDERNRYSLVWEYAPIQFLQLRLGVRVHDGIPQSAPQNRREGFLELHGFF